MAHESPEIIAARNFAKQAATMLGQTTAFQKLDSATRSALVRDLSNIQHAFGAKTDPYASVQSDYSGRRVPAKKLSTPATSAALGDPYALSLATPNDLAARRNALRESPAPEQPGETDTSDQKKDTPTPSPRTAATETLASRAGALSDEINFPAFVAGLIHGTFDAMVDAAIRQMEAFAELVSAVAKDLDRFTSENVTANQVRDWLVQQYPRDLVLEFPTGAQPRVTRRVVPGEEDSATSPSWLADYGLEGQELTDELIEEQLVPMARRRVGENRLQTLATMVLMGMNRIVIKDGTISAKVRFRAAAHDKANVDYAISQDPGQPGWGARGSSAYGQSSMMVSTVGVNVQAESELKAELFGEVKINFVSETLPLDRFVDSAQMTLLQRHTRASSATTIPGTATPVTDNASAGNAPPITAATP